LNFFGHCVAASWHQGAPAFTFGAMVPDFASMVGQRPPRALHPTVASGIEFHHLTDRCFHAGHHFLTLQSQARDSLRASGIAKGPRLAVAHIGVEIVLDSWLAHSAANLALYGAALDYGAGARGFIWPNAKTTSLDAADNAALDEQLRQLAQRLRDNVEQLIPRDASAIAQRLTRILQRHPALRLPDSARNAVTQWAEAASQEVFSVADLWLTELRNAVMAEWSQAVAAAATSTP
jgi:hypothetical protein